MQHAIAAKSAAWHQSSQASSSYCSSSYCSCSSSCSGVVWLVSCLPIACCWQQNGQPAACCMQLERVSATWPGGVLLPPPAAWCLLQCRVEFFISFGAAIHLNGNFVSSSSSSSSAASSGNRKCQTNNRTHWAYYKRFLYWLRWLTGSRHNSLVSHSHMA